ncbi:hypothetical protein HXA31_12795 [Salipaludibacillus agaradhaerens]|uniref:Rubrerythrin family protein n=1 Tax=Salipaludibacillus agaradhaerens TaxID=76935 RepID=A0A9Q4AYG8_SALAG|nr:hypothetical protein [Salipaludibacillus agaradhaerens]MCR6095203.1 hypothetical protein [Salipaludibacillus agaradhaerens]MCR6115239.1 hypothetical protein [Salipaludibacillus agaradhaerens]
MQQQPSMNQGQNMPHPPPVITTKDHLYINDMLAWNLLAMKKAHAFSQQCSDQEVSQALDQAGRMHQEHYQTLLTHLQTQGQSGSQTLQ